jgi:hypothetical protein
MRPNLRDALHRALWNAQSPHRTIRLDHLDLKALR